MAATAIESLVILFASSTAINMAYVALPDYRYRNKIIEYLEHLVCQENERDLNKNSTQSPRTDRDKVETLLRKASERQRENSNGKEYWLQFLLEVHSFSRGHIPNKIRSYPIVDGKERHWLQKPFGLLFCFIYLRHRDNITCITFASVGLLFTAMVQWMAIFRDGSAAQWFEPNMTLIFSFLFSLGLLGILVPSGFAFLGRVLICTSARKAIDTAVKSLLAEELDAGIAASKKGVSASPEQKTRE